MEFRKHDLLHEIDVVWLSLLESSKFYASCMQCNAKFESVIVLYFFHVKLGPQCKYHEGQVAIRHYANQTARPLWPLRRGPNFKLRDRGVNTHLA